MSGLLPISVISVGTLPTVFNLRSQFFTPFSFNKPSGSADALSAASQNVWEKLNFLQVLPQQELVHLVQGFSWRAVGEGGVCGWPLVATETQSQSKQWEQCWGWIVQCPPQCPTWRASEKSSRIKHNSPLSSPSGCAERRALSPNPWMVAHFNIIRGRGEGRLLSSEKKSCCFRVLSWEQKAVFKSRFSKEQRRVCELLDIWCESATVGAHPPLLVLHSMILWYNTWLQPCAVGAFSHSSPLLGVSDGSIGLFPLIT